MAKPNNKRKRSGKVLLRKMTDLGEGYQIARNPGILHIFSFRGGGRKKTLGIYGDPKGLRFLAKLLEDIANIDQSKIADINCPPTEGVHYHMDVKDGHLSLNSHSIIFGRVDAKGDGSREWILPTSSANR